MCKIRQSGEDCQGNSPGNPLKRGEKGHKMNLIYKNENIVLRFLKQPYKSTFKMTGNG